VKEHEQKEIIGSFFLMKFVYRCWQTQSHTRGFCCKKASEILRLQFG